MGSRIQIVGQPAYSWGRRTQPPEVEVPRRRGALMGVLITSVVILGIGAGLFLLVSDQRVLDETIALASPNAIPNEIAPLPPLTSLPPLTPRAVETPVAASVPEEPTVEVSSEPTTPAARRTARSQRRAHRADAADGAFRRATRVGRSRL